MKNIRNFLILNSFFAIITVNYVWTKGLAPGETRVVKKDSMVKVFVPLNLKHGDENSLMLVVRSIFPWKINDKFPHKVYIKAPQQIKFRKSIITRADALKIEKERIVFSVPFVALSQGKFDLNVKFEFSVCREDICQIYMGQNAVEVRVNLNVE